VNTAPGAFHGAKHLGGKRGEDVPRTIVYDGMCGVQPQTIYVVLLNPAERVLDNVIADRFAARSIEVDSHAPRTVMSLRIIVAAEGRLVSAIRTQMVINHVEVDGEPQKMRAIHKPAQIVRISIATRRSEWCDAAEDLLRWLV